MPNITKWPGLYAKDDPQPTTFRNLTEMYRTILKHQETPDKFLAEGFSPYVLTPRPCKKHATEEPHRCDAQVDAITLAVFDVDQGTLDDIERCDEALDRDRIERVWYTSYSYPKKESWRLILALDEPVPARNWKAFRLILIQKYGIPADRSACSGLSHFYFLPACPPGAERDAAYFGGRPVRVASYPIVATSDVLDYDEFEDDEEEDDSTPVDMAQVRETLKKRAEGLSRSGDNKGVWLRRALKGEALAEHGERNVAMMKTAGVIMYACPDLPKKAAFEMLKPSLRQMVAAGSSLTEAQVWRMLTTSRNNQRARAERLEEFERRWRAGIKR